MNTHPLLRAYMAGITAPTIFMLVVLTGFCIARFGMGIPVPIERALVFPMAVIPNVFGVWNLLYVGAVRQRNIPIGPYGAILPFLLMPAGVLVATSLGFLGHESGGIVWFGAIHVPYLVIALLFPLVVTLYYLVWKYLVGGLNGVLGIE